MIEKVYETQLGTIHYWTNEVDRKRLTLVFLPGLTADHRLFEKQITFFKEKYNVLVWDAPAHGKSRPFLLQFSLEDKAVYLHEIIKQEKLVKYVLIGQSMGGYVGQAFIERFPGEAAGFVSIDSAPLQRKYMTVAEIWLLKRTEPMYRLFPWKTLLHIGMDVAVSEYGRQLISEIWSIYEKEEYVKLTGHGFKILAEAVEKNLPYIIDCPALLLCGEMDKAGSAKRYNKRWEKIGGLPLKWVAKAGHNSNTDNPEMVNEEIKKFVETIS